MCKRVSILGQSYIATSPALPRWAECGIPSTFMSIIQLPFFNRLSNQWEPKPKAATTVGQDCIEARISPNCLHSFVWEWLPALFARENPYNNGNQNERKTKIPERYRRHQTHRRSLPRIAQPAAKFWIKDQRMSREKPDFALRPSIHEARWEEAGVQP